MIYSNKYQSKIFSRVFRENIGCIQNAPYFRIVLIETFYTELLTLFYDKSI